MQTLIITTDKKMTTPTNISPKPTNTSKKMLLLFHLLLLIYPILYFMQQNVAEFSFKTYANTLSYIVKYDILLIVVYTLSQIFNKKWLHISYITLVSVAFAAILTTTLCCLTPISAIPYTLIVLSLSYILYYKNFIKPFVYMLGFMCLLSIGMYLYPLLFIHENKDPNQYPEMAYKPNIYMLILESYQGNEALKRLYGFDNHLFLKYLVQNGFMVYQDMYSTRPTTRTSLMTILTLKNLPDTKKKVHLLDGCLTGKKPCYVLDMLRQNGYDIKTKFPNTYLIKNYFDVPNMDKQFLCDTLFSKYYTTYFEKCITQQIIKYNTADDFNLDVIQTIKNLKAENSPYLFITKIGGITEDEETYQGGLAHLPNIYRHTNQINLLPQIKGNYIRELKKENIALTYIIQTIISKDPNAMIVMFGDHGANHFDIFKNYQAMYRAGLPLRDYILDLFNVLVAIRYPNDIKSAKKWQYLPEMFPVIFDALGTPLDKVNILPVVYDYNNNPYYRN